MHRMLAARTHHIQSRLSGCFGTSNRANYLWYAFASFHNVPGQTRPGRSRKMYGYDCEIAWSIIFTYLFIKCYSKSLLFNVRNCFDSYYLNAWMKWVLSRHWLNEGRSVGRSVCDAHFNRVRRIYIDFTMATQPSFQPWKIVRWMLIASILHLK